ncbi:tripartite motif-containing protein 16-like [Protopterus annectens]|uniref:tripartite motif-containing protein 16-like n=1 Tax=Protopterus annectens TaxID=7888 RepID=UPI001CFA7C7F|nr:tripartite motif-containing protein 16-like [Protopterus annectens]
MSESNHSEKQFFCSICSKVFERLITLMCGHSLCEVCAQQMGDINENNKQHNCPQCKQSSTGPEVQINSTVNGVMDMNSKADNSEEQTIAEDGVFNPDEVMCDFCIEVKVKAVKSCLTCMVSYCGDHLRPHLENIKLQHHRLIMPLTDMEMQTCETHKQQLVIFCQSDHKCLCEECYTTEHAAHDTLPLIAARKEKEIELQQMESKLDQQIQAAENAVNKLQGNVTSIESSMADIKDKTEDEFNKLMAAVKEAHKETLEFLENEQRTSVNQANSIRTHLEQKCTELKKNKDQIRRFKSHSDAHFIQEICEWKKNVTEDPLPSIYIGLKDRLSGIGKVVSESSENIIQLLQTSYMKKLQELVKEEKCGIKTMVAAVVAPKHRISAPDPETRADFLQYASTLTFDKDTAHRYLRLLDDNHKVTNVSPWQQSYPDHPKRFENWQQVLCSESLYIGRHYFEVELRGEGTYVGMTYENIPRKGSESDSCITGSNFSWCIKRNNKEFSAWHNNVQVPIEGRMFNRIGVYLDFGKGTLAFYGVTSKMTLMHTFIEKISEPLFPAFWLSKKETSVQLMSLREGETETCSTPETVKAPVELPSVIPASDSGSDISSPGSTTNNSETISSEQASSNSVNEIVLSPPEDDRANITRVGNADSSALEADSSTAVFPAENGIMKSCQMKAAPACLGTVATTISPGTANAITELSTDSASTNHISDKLIALTINGSLPITTASTYTTDSSSSKLVMAQQDISCVSDCQSVKTATSTSKIMTYTVEWNTKTE